MLMVLAGAGWTWDKFRLCFMHHFWAESPYIVYEPLFKLRLLDPRIKCWQKPTLTHSVFYIAVKLQRDKT